MRAIELKCVEPGHTDKHWLLDIRGDQAVLCTPNGEQVAVFRQQHAKRRFQMPGLANGIKHFSIALDEQTVPFAVDFSGLNQIERYLNRDLIVPRQSSPAASGQPVRTHALNARPRSGIIVTRPVRIFFGVLAIMFILMHLASIVMTAGQLSNGNPYSLSGLLGHITGAAIGLIIAIACFRRKSDAAADELS